MSMRDQIKSFAGQAAAARGDWFGTSLLTPVVDGADLPRVDVPLSPDRATREFTVNGDVTVHLRSVRVPWSATWKPAERDEFLISATGERYRIRKAVASETMAETVCEAVRV